eukprot:TRINITY_DN1553_c0_g1_i1.p1 TRINITY_DN1553_c0_g1~~TRINITY_DN1553_c0_g1_i1.p1  ORF type:complete len:304 (-),score=48.32 TRINITY_DN1553_c0_g1_i1:25-861(-)
MLSLLPILSITFLSLTTYLFVHMKTYRKISSMLLIWIITYELGDRYLDPDSIFQIHLDQNIAQLFWIFVGFFMGIVTVSDSFLFIASLVSSFGLVGYVVLFLVFMEWLWVSPLFLYVGVACVMLSIAKSDYVHMVNVVVVSVLFFEYGMDQLVFGGQVVRVLNESFSEWRDYQLEANDSRVVLLSFMVMVISVLCRSVIGIRCMSDHEESEHAEEMENFLEGSSSEDECCICLDAAASCTFQPCGHHVCCRECAQTLSDVDNRCPICRAEIEMRIQDV